MDVDINPERQLRRLGRRAAAWPGGEGALKMQVQTDLDWDKFIRLYVERVTSTRPAAKR